jgi:hypothetical protein
MLGRWRNPPPETENSRLKLNIHCNYHSVLHHSRSPIFPLMWLFWLATLDCHHSD